MSKLSISCGKKTNLRSAAGSQNPGISLCTSSSRFSGQVTGRRNGSFPGLLRSYKKEMPTELELGFY
jgi:hypothetical protein